MLRINRFNDKSGYVVVSQRDKEFKFNLYGEGKCNCFLATVWESEPDDEGLREYQLQWFFNDERHGKIMLGLQKGNDGRKENYLCEVTKLIIFKKQCPNWKKIVTMFAEAFDNLTIEIREEE